MIYDTLFDFSILFLFFDVSPFLIPPMEAAQSCIYKDRVDRVGVGIVLTQKEM